jgi:hypothetical protein
VSIKKKPSNKVQIYEAISGINSTFTFNFSIFAARFQAHYRRMENIPHDFHSHGAEVKFITSLSDYKWFTLSENEVLAHTIL